MMIPANPGGGWDTTGRALGKALQEAGAATAVTYENKGGAAGAIGLAQFVNASKGDPNALMVMGAGDAGRHHHGNKPPVSLTQATPLARLTSEYNVFVLPAQSPLKTMGRGRADEEGPRQREVGRWFGGSTEHIADRHDRARSGRRPDAINYVPFRGGGEATAAILGGNVTVGGSGYSEFQQYIESGKMRAIGMTSGARQKGINVPTLKEQGINVELGNWRGVYGAPGITKRRRRRWWT
jgi:putative tricarboxylic transport membrane protein